MNDVSTILGCIDDVALGDAAEEGETLMMFSIIPINFLISILRLRSSIASSFACRSIYNTVLIKLKETNG